MGVDGSECPGHTDRGDRDQPALPAAESGTLPEVAENERQNACLKVRRIPGRRGKQVDVDKALLSFIEADAVIGRSQGLQREISAWGDVVTALGGEPGVLRSHRTLGLRTP